MITLHTCTTQTHSGHIKYLVTWLECLCKIASSLSSVSKTYICQTHSWSTRLIWITFPLVITFLCKVPIFLPAVKVFLLAVIIFLFAVHFHLLWWIIAIFIYFYTQWWCFYYDVSVVMMFLPDIYTCGDNIISMLAVWRIYPSSGNLHIYNIHIQPHCVESIFTWISHPCSKSNQNASRRSWSHSDYGACWVDNVS